MLLRCHLGYSGRWAPRIDFRDALGKFYEGSNVTVVPGTAEYTLALTADRAWNNGGDFQAVTSIQNIAESGDPPNTDNGEADNQPSFPINEKSTIAIPDFQVWCKYKLAVCMQVLCMHACYATCMHAMQVLD